MVVSEYFKMCRELGALEYEAVIDDVMLNVKLFIEKRNAIVGKKLND